MSKTFILICLFSLTACAFNPQTVNLNPELSISGDTVKGLKVLAIQVIDDRPNVSLGQRLSNMGPGGEITTTQELVDVVKAKLSEGFNKRGFIMVSDNASTEPTNIIAQIRALDYTASMGFWTVGSHASGAITILAKNKERSFKKMYRTRKEIRSALGTTAKGNEKVINLALSDLLSMIVNDKELFNFLTAP